MAASGRWRLALAAPVLALACAGRADAALSGGARLAAVYDTILDARFDQVDAELRQACPPAPEGACQSLRVVSLSWQILANPESRVLDRQFDELAASVIAANTAWTAREPLRAEAWFYLAGLYAPRVQWRVLRGERLGAALDGRKVKDALERALQLDPTIGDAYFGIGLYHYYADIAPPAAKALRWLLQLPGGDRVNGLREIAQGRDRGEVLKEEADYQLHVLYLWYEQKTPEALRILEALDARHPHNPLFRRSIAEALDTYVHDHAASAAAWQLLLGRALLGAVFSPRTTEVRARLGLGREFAALNRNADAAEQWQRVVEMRPVEPPGAQAAAERALRASTTRRQGR